MPKKNTKHEKNKGASILYTSPLRHPPTGGGGCRKLYNLTNLINLINFVTLMSKIILIYVTCPSVQVAEDIGTALLTDRLCACVNIIPGMKSLYFWPPKTGKIEKSEEAILLIKTVSSKYEQVEHTVARLHPSNCPCIIQFTTILNGYQPYLKWLQDEVKINKQLSSL